MDVADSIRTSLESALDELLQRLPALLAAAGLLLLGWLLAWLLRTLAVRGFASLLSLLRRRADPDSAANVARAARTLGRLVFWAVLLIFIVAASDVLGLGTLSGLLARLLDYLPTLAAGLLIIAAGFLLSRAVGDLARRAASRLEGSQREALGRLAQLTTLVAALLVGADQMGIEVTWIAILILLVLATVLGGATVALSLGARAYVANLIGAFYVKQAFQVGQRVRVAGFEGRILDMTATSLVIETADGRAVIPARIYMDEPMILLADTGHG